MSSFDIRDELARLKGRLVREGYDEATQLSLSRIKDALYLTNRRVSASVEGPNGPECTSDPNRIWQSYYGPSQSFGRLREPDTLLVVTELTLEVTAKRLCLYPYLSACTYAYSSASYSLQLLAIRSVDPNVLNATSCHTPNVMRLMFAELAGGACRGRHPNAVVELARETLNELLGSLHVLVCREFHAELLVVREQLDSVIAAREG